MPEEFEDQLGDWAFGCDICQDVCPWNQKAERGHIDDLKPRDHVLKPPKNWTELNEDEFEDIFEGSAVRRAGYERFTENAKLVELNKKKLAQQI